jgi:ankyrin repeat protein
MKYSAHASSREVDFREEKLNTCVSGPKKIRPKTIIASFIRSALLQFEAGTSDRSMTNSSSLKSTHTDANKPKKQAPLNAIKADKTLVKPNPQKLNTETLSKDLAGCLKDDAFHKAAARGNIKFVQSCLILGVDVNVTEGNKWTPLHSASRQGHLDIVTLLHENNANLNARDAYRRTPLDHATIGKNPAIINFLINNGGTDKR